MGKRWVCEVGGRILEDDVIHSASRSHQDRGENRQRAALFDRAKARTIVASSSPVDGDEAAVRERQSIGVRA